MKTLTNSWSAVSGAAMMAVALSYAHSILLTTAQHSSRATHDYNQCN